MTSLPNVTAARDDGQVEASGRISSSPADWAAEFAIRTPSTFLSSAGHVWVRFHRWAFMRYPPNDVAPVAAAEVRELFLRARAPVISHHRLAHDGDPANALLYLCRDREYDLAKLSANNRSKVRRGLKRLHVRRAQPSEVARSGYTCYLDTHSRNGLAAMSQSEFEARWLLDRPDPTREVWAAFSGDEIAALGIVRICGSWAEIASTSSATAHLPSYPNHALFYTMLHDLMHRPGIESVSYGLSSLQTESHRESLHRFKLSVNLEALPVVRRIEINPFLRPAVNRFTLGAVRAMARRFPDTLGVRAARGALELVMGQPGVTLPGGTSPVIRELTAADAPRIASLHRDVFPSYDSSRLGTGFCTRLYRGFATHPDGFGVVSSSDNGVLSGFAVGGSLHTHGAVSRSLRVAALIAVLSRPDLIIEQGARGLRRVLRRIKPKAAHSPPPVRDRARDPDEHQPLTARLVLVGIAQEARGTGLVSRLLAAFADQARRRGYERISLTVSRANTRARRAYEREGWICRDAGGESIEYYRDISTSLPESSSDE